jgi:hypothetical protein
MSQLVINAVQDKIKELQAEFELVNTFGKSDNAENERARARLNASLKQIISSVNYDRTMLSGADTFFKDINTQAVTAENLFIANTLWVRVIVLWDLTTTLAWFTSLIRKIRMVM